MGFSGMEELRRDLCGKDTHSYQTVSILSAAVLPVTIMMQS